MGRATWVLRARTLPKTLAIAAAVIAAALGLTFIHKDFNLSAEGTLEPTVNGGRCSPPIDGEVLEVLVATEQRRCAKGDVLVRLRNPEIAHPARGIDRADCRVRLPELSKGAMTSKFIRRISLRAFGLARASGRPAIRARDQTLDALT